MRFLNSFLSLCVLLVITTFVSTSANAQDYNYSFTSNSKSFQETNSNGEIVKSSLWEPTQTSVIISKDLCVVSENEIISEYQIQSSKLDFEHLTKVNIQAIKEGEEYELELALIEKGKYFFVISNKSNLHIYLVNSITKTKV